MCVCVCACVYVTMEGYKRLLSEGCGDRRRLVV